MSEPTVAGFILAGLALALFVISAWKASSWLTRRGNVARPLTMMDDQMTRIEKRAAKNRQAQASGDIDQTLDR
jgi:hypothetical protein